MNNNIDKKNKLLAIVLGGIALVALLGAITWFNIYAPLILSR